MKNIKTQPNTAKVINGLEIANILESKIAKLVCQLKNTHNIEPQLGAILVEGNSACEIYVKRKQKKAAELGIKTIIKKYSPNIDKSKITKQIEKWNSNKEVHGILVQLPLPSHIDKYEVIHTIAPNKDVDGLHSLNIGKLSWQVDNKLVACTPQGCLELLKTVIDNFTGMHAVIVGCSNLVGRPMAQLLLQNDCSVSIVHSKTPDISVFTKQADILISATGQPNLIGKNMLKDGVIVIDVGINKLPDGRIIGDVNFAESVKIVNAITPVPGGVGPMTIANLMKNLIVAIDMQNNLSISKGLEI